MESLAVNSSSLEKQLKDRSVQLREIEIIMDTIDKRYHESVDAIVEECDKDIIALEHVPSPLRLFVDCIAEAQKSLNLSQSAQSLMRQYMAAWEDWM